MVGDWSRAGTIAATRTGALIRRLLQPCCRGWCSGTPKRRFVGTNAWFFLIVNATKVPFSVGLGLMRWSDAGRALALAPAVLLGGARLRDDQAHQPGPLRRRGAGGERRGPAALLDPLIATLTPQVEVDEIVA